MAFDYYKKMLVAGFSPSLQAYHILLEACTQHGDFVRANNVLMELQDQGYKPTSQTMTLVLKVLATSIDGDLVLPEHPAGNRRFTRKEYEEWKRGVPVARKKDRLDYVRELRTREIDDGLGPDSNDEVEDEDEENSQGSSDFELTPIEEKKDLINEELVKKIATTKVVGSGRTRGLTEKEISELNRIDA